MQFLLSLISTVTLTVFELYVTVALKLVTKKGSVTSLCFCHISQLIVIFHFSFKQNNTESSFSTEQEDHEGDLASLTALKHTCKEKKGKSGLSIRHDQIVLTIGHIIYLTGLAEYVHTDAVLFLLNL